MNRSLKLLVFLILLSGFQSVNAQFFKKLKDRAKEAAERTVEIKVEEKAEQKTDQAIDSIFSIGNGKKRNKKRSPKKENQRSKDEKEVSETYGNAIISGPNHGPTEITDIAKPKITLDNSNNTTRISAWWVTHGTDAYDMFDLSIHKEINFDSDLPISLNLPDDASLLLYYDGLLGAYLGSDSMREEDPEFELVYNAPELTGTVILSSYNENIIEFTFDTDGFSGSVLVNDPELIIVEKVKQKTTKVVENEPAFTLKPGKPGFYQFNYEIETLVISSDGESYPISYVLNKEADYFGMKADMSAYGDGDVEGSSVIVMQNGETRIFVDTPMMKMQMSQNMGGQQGQEMPEMGNYNYSKPIKTGNTKTILNYTCYEYIVEQDGGKVSFWAAPDVVIPNWMFGSKDAVEQTGVLGFVLEFTATDKQGTTTSKVTGINDNYKLEINASDYKKMF
ncbi:hypothetical protein ACFSQJ_18345 [Croceitalea marina]|uniref:DUF4412 domain-containing protein n=1 Tax=Croceitalea marina TaxID=1775166 RepID=A0ABW5MZU2_9FLAO